MKFSTLCVHAGVRPDREAAAIMTPIYQSSTFVFDDVGVNKGFDYSRSGNPTRRALEESIAALEGGAACVATSSGMSAEATIIQLFRAGDHIICGNDIYGGTFRLFRYFEEHYRLRFSFIPLQDESLVRKHIRPETKAIWIETPTNPILNLVDLNMAIGIARQRGLLTIVDNTFLSPCFLRPFEYGADIVFHSTTKYLNGHSDVIGGAIVSATEELGERIWWLANAYGTTTNPFESFLVLRGIKTLPVRMRAHEENALAVAGFLEEHRSVSRVYYPGLPSHRHHDLARRQLRGYGGVVSFEVRGGWEAAKRVLRATRIFALAESLGGVESLLEHPKTMSHASMTPEAQVEAGITDGLIRLSCGIEDKDDLVEDLRQALEP